MSKEKDPRKIKAKQWMLAGDTIVSIAARLKVNRKTIERWAEAGGWKEEIQAQKVVSINQSREDFARVRSQRQREQINETELIELALSDISAAMSLAKHEDIRSLGSLVSGLVKLLEYRRKINPPTAADLAEQMILLGVPPAELVAELKRQWQLRA